MINLNISYSCKYWRNKMLENTGFDARERIAKEVKCILILSTRRHETPEQTANTFVKQGFVERYAIIYKEHPDYSPKQLVELIAG